MSHERDLRDLLQRVRRRWSGTVFMRALARGAGGAALVILLAAAADVWLSPRDLPLVALGAATLAGVVACGAWAVWPLRTRPSDRQVARFVEERCPELEDRLASATALAGRTGAEPMRGLVIADAAARARQIETGSVVSRDALARATWQAAAAVAVLLVSGLVGWAPAARVVSAARAHLLPGALSLIVEPGDARVIAGGPFRVTARLAGSPAALAGTTPAITVTVAGSSASAAMSLEGDAFALDLPPVTASFTYRVTAARAASPEYSVTALFPPRVERIDVSYEYPSFTGLAPRTETDGGDIYAPAGTNVRLRVRADKPIRAGALVMDGGRRLELTPDGEVVLEGGLQIIDDGSYRVALSDADGLESAGETEYFIRVMNDRPPDVRILRPAGDRTVTALEEVPIEARADDHYGIATFELVYSVRGGEERAVPLQGGGGPTSRTASHMLFLEDLGVEPGDFISYYARARDVARGKRSSEGRSDIFFLEVKPFDSEFEMAQSQTGAGSGSASLDSLVRAQKDVISATWKLDRRRQGGRSEADIKAVARAQGELKRQAEAALASAPRASRRSRSLAGQDEPPAGEPLAAAAAAMGRAQDALDALRTDAALPHEMQALNELLKAQAEVRRRQVSRQQAGGGGGSGRADRDLSALFDRELQRQQETNYETPRNQRDEATERNDALDEIRELARRQNELSRQQRDLAQASLDADELKRQLERLTREQNELRQRAEELAHRMQQQGSQAPRGQQGEQAPQAQTGGQAGGESLEGITGEMRGAASDLRRQDLESASARSARAAEALRELDERLRGSRPGAAQRALGELQLEARQMADAQARLADEAQRTSAPGAADAAETRRRLAGEQARLADRAERLEQAATSLGSSGDAQNPPVAEALGAIAQADLERRMREAAEALRPPDAGADERVAETSEAGGKAADATRRLAESLESIADALESASGVPRDEAARALAERLARARALGERLEALEPEIARAGRAAGTGQAAERSTGEAGRQGGARGGGAAADLTRLQDEYARALREAQDLLDDLRQSGEDTGRGLSPESHQYTMGAPGTQAFKQDFSRWESLRRDVGLALERYEEALLTELAAELADGRLNAGASAAVLESYRALIASYYEALAKKKK